MKKNLLLFVLLLSFLFEGFLMVIAFFNPAATLKIFKLTYNADTAVLAYFTGWFLLFITSTIGYLFYLVVANKPGARGMINLLGLWWLGLGVAIYFMFGKTNNLLTDSLKGAVLLLLNYLYYTNQPTGFQNNIKES